MPIDRIDSRAPLVIGGIADRVRESVRASSSATSGERSTERFMATSKVQ